MIQAHEQAIRAYEQRARLRNNSPATVTASLDVIHRFLVFVGRRWVSSVTKDDVRRYLANRSRSTKGTDRELGVLRGFFEVTFPEGKTLPTEGLSIKRAATGPRIFLSQEAVKAILAVSIDPSKRGRGFNRLRRALVLRDRALIELLYALGPRASEVSASRVADLDFDAGAFLIRRAKRGTSRFLPVPQRSLKHLALYVTEGRPVLVRKSQDDEGALLLSFRGRPLTTSGVQGLVARLGKLAGLRAHPHAFRRGLASDLVHGGAGVPTVRELLGHKSLATTAVYLDVSRDDLRRAVETLERDRR